MTQTANASPKASVRVVEVVGAIPITQASGAAGKVKRYCAARINVLSSRPDMPIIGIENRATWATISPNSAVSPEFEIKITKSSGVIIPKSPWLASAGWTKAEGVPVEARVELILRAICPDFPIPDKITRPFVASMASTAPSKSAGKCAAKAITASASIFKTRAAVSRIAANLSCCVIISCLIWLVWRAVV